MTATSADPLSSIDPIACIVLTVGARAEVVAAVRSIVEQGTPAEVVVVNSGGGDAAQLLERSGLRVKVVEFGQRVLPGAARNAGIRVTSAPVVAFLAGDCIAESGWLEARLDAHGRGARVVATAVTNAYPRSLSAWTSYVALFSRRMPGVAPSEALHYGASYDRALFDEFGMFREDLRGGEDTEFHERIGASVATAWAPGVRTAHRHPVSVRELVSDQFRRGRRSAAAWSRLRRYGAVDVALNAWRRMLPDFRRARRAAEGVARAWVTGTMLLLPLATLAYSLGAFVFALRRKGGDEV